VYGGWLRKERTAFARWVKRDRVRVLDALESFAGYPWISENGKWSIVPNGDGYDDIPFIVLGFGRWTAAHVFADGYTMTTGSKPLPAYVHKMAVSLVNGNDTDN